MKTIQLIKQDSNRSIGIYQDHDGTYLALTYSSSKWFKTQKGARNWLARRGYPTQPIKERKQL